MTHFCLGILNQGVFEKCPGISFPQYSQIYPQNPSKQTLNTFLSHFIVTACRRHKLPHQRQKPRFHATRRQKRHHASNFKVCSPPINLILHHKKIFKCSVPQKENALFRTWMCTFKRLDRKKENIFSSLYFEGGQGFYYVKTGAVKYSGT